MKKVQFLLFIFLLLQNIAFSQKSYFKLIPTTKGTILSKTNNLNEAMKWDYYSSINISKPDGFSTKWYPDEQSDGQTVPQTGSLFDNEMNIEFDAAADEWCKGTADLLKIHTNVSQDYGADVFFTTSIQYFPNMSRI